MNEEALRKYRYLQDMLNRMPDREDNPFKWNRWLGFVQGAVWALGLKDIPELKTDNKAGLASSLNKLRNDIAVLLIQMGG